MEAMRKRMAEMQKRREESLRKRLGATEEEWKVLYPRIKKVQDLQSAQGRTPSKLAGKLKPGRCLSSDGSIAIALAINMVVISKAVRLFMVASFFY